ncbi:cytochrome b-c1 complex subunit 6, mitochondrial-like [Diorhabda carinulata]|uniref:cytochrome b-c1 complex subunit 6, mitochondrial-like n=1 Tax=Diorhabda carinulata TaxID=1163345 RepID=UPI0025A061E8|nr:cytochrome b-c1 complex subunit 6, mitochondrial-like [Diorhabda carinulata]
MVFNKIGNYLKFPTAKASDSTCKNREDKTQEEKSSIRSGDDESREEESVGDESASQQDESSENESSDSTSSRNEASEEELEDPLEVLRSKCRETELAQRLSEKYQACNDRVNGKRNTAETCVEELFDWLHVVDKCVAKDIFNHLK